MYARQNQITSKTLVQRPETGSPSYVLAGRFRKFLLGALMLLTFAATGNQCLAQEIQWRSDLEAAKQEALRTDRLVWLHFTADWCRPCQKLDTFVFSKIAVIRAIDKNVVAVKIDADEREDLVKKYNVQQLPYELVMTPGGQVFENRRSPKDSANFQRFIEGLDSSVQELKSGNRDAINFSIDQIARITKAKSNLQQFENIQASGPDAAKQASSKESNSLKRSFDSLERRDEYRRAQAAEMKRQAEAFIASEKRRLSSPQVTTNPFFQAANETVAPSGNKQMVNSQSSFLPPQPPVFAKNEFAVKKVDPADEIEKFETADEFEFSKQPTQTSEPIKVAVANDDSNDFFLPQVSKSTEPSERLEQKQANTTESNTLNLQLETAQAFEPKTAQAFEPKTAQAFEPKTAQAFEPKTAQAFEPKTAQAFEPKTAQAFEPKTAQAVLPPSSPIAARAKDLAAKPARAKPTMTTAVSMPQPPAMVFGTNRAAKDPGETIVGKFSPIAVNQPPRKPANLQTGLASQAIEYRKDSTSQPATDALVSQVNFFEPRNTAKTTPSPTPTAPLEPPAKMRQQSSQPQLSISAPTASPPNSVQPTPTPSRALLMLANEQRRAKEKSAASPLGLAKSTKQAPATAANQPAAKPSITPDKINDIAKNDLADPADETPKASTAIDVKSASRSKYALKGKCPVTLLTEGRWIDGQTTIGCVHRDRVYLFASDKHRDAFQADPDQFSPLLAGFDPVIFKETGKLVEGAEQFGVFMGKTPSQRIVLFQSSENRARFQSSPKKYLDKIRQAMTDSVAKEGRTKLR